MANSILVDAHFEAQAGQAAQTPVDFDSDALYVLLVDATGAGESDPTKQGHVYVADANPHEVTGVGYTAGGVQLSSTSVAMSGHVETFTAANASWTASTITASGCWIYKRVGASINAATDLLIGYWDFGGSIASSGGTFLIAWSASGIMYWAHA